jgi:hypothetical protein
MLSVGKFIHMRLCNKGINRLFVIAVAVVAILIIGVGQCDSEYSDSILVFEDDRSLILTWEQANDGVNVTVCNIARNNDQPLRVALTGFNFQVDNKPIADAEVLKQPDVVSILNAGMCTIVSVQAKNDGITPDSGEYKGLLVLSSPGADIIRREVIVYGPTPNTKTAVLESAVDKIILTATRNIPMFSTASLDYPYIPLKPGSTGETLVLPTIDTHIGNIYDEGHFDRVYGRIYVNGKPMESQDGVVLLPIRVDGLDEVGTYSGKLDITSPSDSDSQATITVQVTDHIVWAIGALILGVLIPLVILYYMQKWRPHLDLKTRGNKLENEYKKANTNFKKEYGKFNFGEYELDIDAIRGYKKDFDSSLSTYDKSNWLFDTNSEDYKNLIKTLETAEDDPRLFGDKNGLGKSLQDLSNELSGFAKFIGEEFPVDRDPVLIKPAADLLKAFALPVGGAEKIKERADGYIKLIKDWEGLAKEIKRYRLWTINLSDKNDTMTPDDQEVFSRAKAKIDEAINEMLDAKDALTLDDLGSAEDLKWAYDQLAYLGSRYGVWEAPEKEKDLNKRKSDYELLYKSICSFACLDINRLFISQDINKWLKQAKSISIVPEKAAEIERSIRQFGDLIVIGLAIAVVILTGLTQLYFGKPFGTPLDYLSVILLGSGTQIALTGLIATIKALKG